MNLKRWNDLTVTAQRWLRPRCPGVHRAIQGILCVLLSASVAAPVRAAGAEVSLTKEQQLKAAYVFNHGFTTKKDGHGFVLHSGANAAKELGGSITLTSDGTGCGATFTLELPAAAAIPEKAA